MSSLEEVPQGPSTFPLNPEEFDADHRISFSRLNSKFILEQNDGSEYEFDDALKRWIPVLDEELLEQQRKAYVVAGVDESEDVQETIKKRKRVDKEYVNGQDEDNGGRTVKVPRKQKAPLPPKPNSAIYVTGLPLDATEDEIAQVFSQKCGVIAEEIDSGRPRIKLYENEKGEFKGDAFILFFKAPSVQMAITLLDDTPLRFGDSINMKVVEADSKYKKSQQNIDGKAAPKVQLTKSNQKDKQKIIKKTQKLDARLADWSDDDEISAITETSSRWDKVVILKHMFTLAEIAEDPAAILDIKEDIRDECAKLGEVTNVVLFDLEEEGIASVRFGNGQAARACVNLMNGRAFAGQAVEAYISDGKELFKRSKKKEEVEEEEEEKEEDN